MISQGPLVSCVVVAHNYEEFVGRAVDSALAQGGFQPQEVEVIVVDDGSTDRTAEVLAGYGDRIRVIRQANAGPTVAMYNALDLARGEYVAFLDADDEWLPGRLRAGVDHLIAHPQVGLVHSDMTIVDSHGSVIKPSVFADMRLFEGRVLGRYIVANQATTSAITVRASLARSVPKAPAWVWCRDWWFAAHIAQHAEIAALKESYVLYRRHDRNVNGLINQDPEKRRSLAARGVKVRRLLMGGAGSGGVDLHRVERGLLIEALQAHLSGIRDLLGEGADAAVEDILNIPETERALAASLRAEAATARDQTDALVAAVRAVVIDPVPPEGHDLVARLVGAAQDPGTSGRLRSEGNSDVIPQPRRSGEPPAGRFAPFVAAAYVDEIAVAPALLTCWVDAIDRSEASLRLLAVTDDPTAAEMVVLNAMAAVGVDPQGQHDFEIVLCGSDEHAEAEVRNGSQMLLTANRVAPALAGIRATHDAAVIRSLAVRWWSK